MAKKVTKRMVHTEAYASKDTFWNRERVKRGITYKQIADRYKVTIPAACKWFIGRGMPRSEDTIRDLCKWFTDTPCADGLILPITYERGLYELEKAHEIYEAEFKKQRILTADRKLEIVDAAINEPDKKETKEVVKSMDTSNDYIKNYYDVNSIHFLLSQRHITYKKLANELKCTVTMIRHWIRGYDMPNDVYIGKMADILEYDPDKLTDLFRREYDKQHNVEGQCTIEDAIKDDVLVPSNKDAASDTDIVYIGKAADILESEPEVKFSPEVEDALKKMADHHDDHERFVKWFNLFASISPVRITEEEIVNIMSQYVCCDYNMFMALEAWHNEDNPSYIHERYILLTCERKNWFGEDYER